MLKSRSLAIYRLRYIWSDGDGCDISGYPPQGLRDAIPPQGGVYSQWILDSALSITLIPTVIKLLGCVMRDVLQVPLGRPLRIYHVSLRLDGSAGATVAELLSPEVLNGYISHTHMDSSSPQGPAPPTNKACSITSRSLQERWLRNAQRCRNTSAV